MNTTTLRGTGVALVTPFFNQSVDYKALTRLIEYVIAGGADYIVSLGTTGEAVTLTNREASEVLHHTIKIVAGRLPIVFGYFGGNNTAQMLRDIQSFELRGVDALLLSSPAYNKPTQEGIFQHYLKIAQQTPLPIILYNVPGRTSSNMQAHTILHLAKAHPNIIGIKEASGDLVQFSKIVRDKPEDFLVLSGDDPTGLASIACGGDGIISVIANAFPAEFSTMVNAALSHDFITARQVHLDLLPIHEYLYIEGNPVGIKAALEVLNLCQRTVRLPLVPLSKKNYRCLQAVMDVKKLEYDFQ